MLADGMSDERSFDVVVVYALSRFYRNAPESELAMRQLQRHGVRVESVAQSLGSDPQPIMSSQITGIFDEQFSLQNGINVTRGMNENAKQGFRNGARPPLGCKSVEAERRGIKSKRKLEIEPAEARLVARMFAISADGEQDRGPLGISGLVDQLNGEGLRTRLGARFGKGPVGAILRAEYYVTGLFPHGRWARETGEPKDEREINFIPIPKIIDRPPFERVEAKLTANDPKTIPPRVVNGPASFPASHGARAAARA